MGSMTHLLTQVFLPFALAMIMAAVGLSLTVGDFRTIARQPKAFVVGILAHLVILPVVALGILYFWPIKPEFAVGLVIVAACPEAIISNYLSQKARGDVALSIAL